MQPRLYRVRTESLERVVSWILVYMHLIKYVDEDFMFLFVPAEVSYLVEQ
jgi:hypothetical protein